ncbi:hypothetical protein [Pseudoalteromonas piscicida]|uniref:Uncharacterized protein n=1 Tax=Pseudoalteromonas piscicida TaxID=43662 RepID=A0A2A5JQQ1_PSEO7|nr:hypothetical protein [Pseudoalteromonas piscicida]PCK31659.1 hypothetical protein CEX98_11095 [Pseudoalteromonas piscicida]
MDPSLVLTLICLIFIIGLYLCHTAYKKIIVRPEFEDEAMQILNEKWQIKRDNSLTKEELLIKRLLIEKRADQLVETALKANSEGKHKKTKLADLFQK